MQKVEQMESDAKQQTTAAPLDPLFRLRELADQLPRELRADWDGTNHYELTSPKVDEYWWLDLSDYFGGFAGIACETTDGKRLGLLMDIAAEVARLRDDGAI